MDKRAKKKAPWWQRPLLWVPVAGVLLIAGALLWYPSLWQQPAFENRESVPFITEVDERVNVNTAGVAELSALPGIGEKKARAIIGHREANGPFTGPEDLLAVPGIGEKTLEGFKDFISFG